jgi:hypothetical protein
VLAGLEPHRRLPHIASMDAMMKWIGGTSAAVVTAFAVGGLIGTGIAPRSEAAAPQQAIADRPAKLASGHTPAAAPVAKPVPAQETRFVVKRILDIPGPIKYGQWYWDEKGVPAGPLVMTVDLDARVLSVFRNGYEIGATAVLLGTDEYPTPLGTFPILSKERHNVSEKYGNAPMPWTLRLTNDGVAIHGGHAVVNGYASHGCISTPDDFAAKLFAIARPGDKVVIPRGATMKMGDPIV